MGRPGFYDEGSLNNQRMITPQFTEVEVNGVVVGQGITLTNNANDVKGGVPCSLGCSTSFEHESQCVKQSFKDSAPQDVSGRPCTVDVGGDGDDDDEEMAKAEAKKDAAEAARAAALARSAAPGGNNNNEKNEEDDEEDEYDWTAIAVACAAALLVMYIIARR